MLLQLGRQLLGVGISQVPDLRIAAIFERRIEVRDQCPESQTLRFISADQNAVGARVGDDAGGTGNPVRARC